MIDILLKLLLALACGAILIRVEPTLARMSKSTHWRIRYALLAIAAGAAWGLIESLGTGRPSPAAVILSIGLAALMISDRRIRKISRR